MDYIKNARFSTRLVLNAALCAGALAIPALPGRALLVDATWDGGAGNTDYNNFLNWNIDPVVPNNGNNGGTYNIFIPGGFTVNPTGTTSVQGLNIFRTGKLPPVPRGPVPDRRRQR